MVDGEKSGENSVVKELFQKNSELTLEKDKQLEEINELKDKLAKSEGNNLRLENELKEANSKLIYQNTPSLQQNLSDVEKNLQQNLSDVEKKNIASFTSFKNEVEKNTSGNFKSYLMSFFIVFAGIYSVVRSV